VYTDLEKTVDQLIRPRKVFTPSGKNRDKYRELYGIYKDLYPALKSIHGRLSSL
jgi:hypothetical protein